MKKGTWAQALITFFFPVILVLTVRWIVIEPFVIPSGSMIPNLLIHDHILVQKFSFGLRMPFSNHWLFSWHQPQAGDIIVFRYPKNPQIYFIKRLIAVPGDQVQIRGGKIKVNEKVWSYNPQANTENESQFDYFLEDNGKLKYPVRFYTYRDDSQTDESLELTVPEGAFFFMGDNRDQSSDGRVWGLVPQENLIGQAWMIWLSCDQMLENMPFICNPQTIRWDRLFQYLK